MLLILNEKWGTLKEVEKIWFEKNVEKGKKNEKTWLFYVSVKGYVHL